MGPAILLRLGLAGVVPLVALAAAAALAATAAGCGSAANTAALDVGADEAGPGLLTGDAGPAPDGSLSAQIQQDHVGVTFVTITCSGSCADVQAVGTGGNPPYAFAWSDGSTTATRHVCPGASTSYTVTVTDTSPAGELSRPPQTAEATLTADVIACPDGGAGDAGAAGSGGPTCVSNPSFEGTVTTLAAVGNLSDYIHDEAPPWHTCDGAPEIADQTGFIGQTSVTLQDGGTVPYATATDGKTYLQLDGIPGSTESVGEQLCTPMPAGSTTHILIDVFDVGAFGPSTSVLVYGSGTLCGQDQVLAEIPVTDTHSWVTHCATLKTNAPVTYMKLRLSVLDDVWIDNMRPTASCP
jgi:hypothetical protein